MNDFGNPLDAKLQEAANFLDAGQKKEARKVLREALELDRNNLATWELLLRATNDEKEELHCVNRILAIDPNHATAKRRLTALHSSSPGSSRRTPSRKKRQETLALLFFVGSLVMVICVGVAGFALLRGGYIPFALPDRTATALADRSASCQVLIDRAIQASGSYCDGTGSNSACYGNTTIKADLIPDSTKRFSERGDMISVKELRRLTASPLSVDGNEWGIAVFKLIANLPRSLPGETVTMVVFGNATLDNDSGNSDTLESFYFSSELGQIACDKVPFDGLMITSPDGGGVHFMINNTELTLMGTASIKAIKNGEMEIGVYKGSARIVSDGEEQYVGAGYKSSVQLGGENGNEATSPPSKPEPLADDELQIACTMSGNYCSDGEITPVSEAEAQAQIQEQITATPTLTLTPSLTPIPSATGIPTNTLLVLPSATLSPAPTNTKAATKPPPPPPPTRTFTATPPRTNTPNTPTTPNTPVVPTPIVPNNTICSDVSLSPLTNPNQNELSMDINNIGNLITITRVYVAWVETPPSQRLDKIIIDGIDVWDKSDPSAPSDIPAEGNWISGVDLTIPSGTTNFLLRFGDSLQANGYEVRIVFDIGCQVIGNK